MPPLAEQQTRMQGFTAVFTVVRLLTPLKLSYEVAKKRAEPYTKIVGELPEMRRDTVELVRKAIAQDRRAYVLVNNRSEGNAPLTVQALSEMLLS
jgi:septum formation topological specificity factor MinE